MGTSRSAISCSPIRLIFPSGAKYKEKALEALKPELKASIEKESAFMQKQPVKGVAQEKNHKLIDVDVPVVGGHAGITILPLLSKTKPTVSFTDEELEQLTVWIQNGGTEAVEAKAGARVLGQAMFSSFAFVFPACIRRLVLSMWTNPAREVIQ
ncbi:uncharacterized protein LOC105800890 [Gossypium raimondii]|uniref:uncharacterized protein LOC105800890 n=1 Tax=Gossypium raimondii TaxID=29730 RepID=UPI00227D3FBD|nr:uncharacterized protein LOC105800890 [Gossypium raimondii]